MSRKDLPRPECFKAVTLSHEAETQRCDVSRFGLANARKVSAFHRSFPAYSVTPLFRLDRLAEMLGVAAIHVKDESYRFGLNAFKVLGGSYAIGSYMAKQLGMDISALPYEKLTSPEVRRQLGPLTFVTATDGNHGRGVAWTARELGQKSVVYLPKGSARERLENIRALGADASITELNYDDAVRLAKKAAEENGWVVVQDTSWEGYEDIPGRIMEGYTTMAYEAYEQLCCERPTHIFLQAGVGAMSGAVTGFFADAFGPDRPSITIVEPNKADCLYRTAEANDGQLHFVSGPMDSIMAGLCCGEPCSIGWSVLRDHADHFVSVPDACAEAGMRLLGRPPAGDPRIVSGESGAVTLGLAAAVMTEPSLRWLREKLQLDEHSRILCFSTEGDTDRGSYRRIVEDL